MRARVWRRSLRVASSPPNPNATVLAIAEKAAELIRAGA
jgi:hypothetical protein